MARGGPGTVAPTPTSTASPQGADPIAKLAKDAGFNKADAEQFKIGMMLGGSNTMGLFGGDGFGGQGSQAGENAWMDRASMNYDGGGY